MKRTLTPIAISLGLALTAVPMTSFSQTAGTMRVALTADPGSWDPIDTFLVAWGSVGSQIYDGLILRDNQLKLQPGLATSWQILDKGKRIRFVLRQNVKFHNGEPYNAEAVKFTFDRLLGEEGKKGPQRSNYSSISEVKIINDNTVDFELSEPDPVLLTKLSGYGAMIVPPKYIKEKGEDYFNAHPVGTGPFRLVSYTPKQSLKLERNSDYWGGEPKIKELEYKFISEPATQVAELQAGKIELATAVPLAMTSVVEKSKGLNLVHGNGPTVSGLRFDVSKGVTKDIRVRKAIIMAVDRNAIASQVLLGYSVPVASMQSKLSFGNDPTLASLPYDPVSAKKLLQQAGVKPGTPVQMDYRAQYPNFSEVMQVVANYVQAIGLRPVLKPYENSVFLNDIVPNGKTGSMFQQSWGGWTYDYDNTAYLLYHSGQKWNPYGKDEKLDKLLESNRSITDVSQREKVLQSIARYVADQALDLPLYNEQAVYGVSQRVQNLEFPPDNRFRFISTSVQ